jgi:hypothetical protein
MAKITAIANQIQGSQPAIARRSFRHMNLVVQPPIVVERLIQSLSNLNAIA